MGLWVIVVKVMMLFVVIFFRCLFVVVWRMRIVCNVFCVVFVGKFLSDYGEKLLRWM